MFWLRGAIVGMGLLGAAGAAAEDIPSIPQHSHYSAVGFASWYGSELNGHRTADGERFDMRALTAAHKTLPIPCYARVTNLRNDRSIVVRVNDRGPFVRGRLIDVSARVASLLGFGGAGVAKVRLEYIGKAAPAGSDAAALLASLKPSVAPVVAKPQWLALRQAPDEGETIVARTVDVPPTPKSPYGELIVGPFLAQAGEP